VKSFLAIIVAVTVTATWIGCASDPPPSPLPPPTTPDLGAHSDRGRVLLAAGDFDRAEKEFALGAAATPPEPGAVSGDVALALARGRFNIAKERLAGHRATLGRRAPWLVAVVDGIQLDEKTVRKPSVNPAKEPSQSAATSAPTEEETALKELLGAGLFQDVVNRLKGNESLSPTSTRLLADAYWNLGQWKQAVPLYRIILRTESNNTTVTLHLADTLMRLQRFDESIVLYQILADSYPDKPGYWKLLGDAARAKGDKPVAIRAYTTALERGHEKTKLTSVVEQLVRESNTESDTTP
jgi:tetratricopeptide (TPR) repeat protein